MNDNNRRRYEMLVRVRDFGTAYAHLFPKSTLAQQAFATVIAGVGEIDAHDLTEASASVSARATRKSVARKSLVERLTLIRKTAGVLAGANEQLREHFALDARNDDALLRTARQFVKQAAPVAAQFIEHGMPPTFLVDLGTLIETFEEALRDRGMSRDDRSRRDPGSRRLSRARSMPSASSTSSSPITSRPAPRCARCGSATGASNTTAARARARRCRSSSRWQQRFRWREQRSSDPYGEGGVRADLPRSSCPLSAGAFRIVSYNRRRLRNAVKAFR
jgi:hypothetical protein